MLRLGLANAGGSWHKLSFRSHTFLPNGRRRSPSRIVGKGGQRGNRGAGRLVHGIFSPDFALVAQLTPGKPLMQTEETIQPAATNITGRIQWGHWGHYLIG